MTCRPRPATLAAARRASASLVLASMLLPWAAVLAPPARADHLPSHVPVARLQVVVKYVDIFDVARDRWTTQMLATARGSGARAAVVGPIQATVLCFGPPGLRPRSRHATEETNESIALGLMKTITSNAPLSRVSCPGPLEAATVR